MQLFPQSLFIFSLRSLRRHFVWSQLQMLHSQTSQQCFCFQFLKSSFPVTQTFSSFSLLNVKLFSLFLISLVKTFSLKTVIQWVKHYSFFFWGLHGSPWRWPGQSHQKVIPRPQKAPGVQGLQDQDRQSNRLECRLRSMLEVSRPMNHGCWGSPWPTQVIKSDHSTDQIAECCSDEKRCSRSGLNGSVNF